MTDKGRNEGQIGGREEQIDEGLKEGRKQASEGGARRRSDEQESCGEERKGEESRGEERRSVMDSP